jgi:hypothetical protein
MDLGPLCSVDDYVAMIEYGSWGQPRMAVNNTSPSIPDTARQTLYYGVVPQPRRRLRLLDLIPISPMDGRSFDFEAPEREALEAALPRSLDLGDSRPDPLADPSRSALGQRTVLRKSRQRQASSFDCS